MSGPCDRARRAAPTTNLSRLSHLLSPFSYASLPRERRAHATTGAGDHRRRRGRLPGSRRTAPSLRTTRSLTCAGVRMRAADVSAHAGKAPARSRAGDSRNRARYVCGSRTVNCRHDDSGQLPPQKQVLRCQPRSRRRAQTDQRDDIGQQAADRGMTITATACHRTSMPLRRLDQPTPPTGRQPSVRRPAGCSIAEHTPRMLQSLARSR